MSVWKKLITAIKGSANEAAEAVVDSQALRILDQEIREAREELRKSDDALVKLIAKRKVADQKVKDLQGSIEEYENHARAAVAKGAQELALECAQKVADLQSQLSAESSYAEQFAQSEKAMRGNISQAKGKLKQLEQQVDIVKATESVQKAQSAVANTSVGANSKMTTAIDSLERIKQRQTERNAELQAAAELQADQGGSQLDKKLADAGITQGSPSSAEDELARILGK